MESGLSMLERGVLEFWVCSRAWRRDPQFATGQTYQSLFDRLHPLLSGQHSTLSRQADDLTNLMVRGKLRRKKGERKSKVIRVDFMTKKASPNNKPLSAHIVRAQHTA